MIDTDEDGRVYVTVGEAARQARAVVEELAPWLHERAPGTHVAIAATLGTAAVIARGAEMSQGEFVDAAAAYYQFTGGAKEEAK